MEYSKKNDRFKFAGSNNSEEVAWYDKNNEYETKPIGLKFPNQLGIYDMSGNVFEWCWDSYDKNFYAKHNNKNPANIEASPYRNMRGGSWRSLSEDCRLAYRANRTSDGIYFDLGFRLAFAY